MTRANRHEEQESVCRHYLPNPSGKIVFRVSGYLCGQRIRKNFSTRAEAEDERQVLGVKALQGDTNLRTAGTRLTDEQLRDAEAAFRRLGDQPKHPLLVYLDFALLNFREPDQEKPLAEAVTEYLGTKRAAYERTLLSLRQLRSIENELKAIPLTGYCGLESHSNDGDAKRRPAGSPAARSKTRPGLFAGATAFALAGVLAGAAVVA